MTITGEPMGTQTTHYDSPGLSALIGKRVRVLWKKTLLAQTAKVLDVDRQAGFMLMEDVYTVPTWLPLSEVVEIREATE
jgi:hypothetical protein